jgi:hypothetical protein
MKLCVLFLILNFISLADLFAQEICNKKALPSMNIDKLIISADVMTCLTTRENNQCSKIEDELESSEKYKVIKCDKDSLEANRLGNVSISDCVWNGLKISGESLQDLAKLPSKIAESISKGFQETQICNSSLDKKRELLNAFNLTIEDSRFTLTENFVGRWLEEAPCSEIEKLLSNRYQNYQRVLMRERETAILTNKKVIPLKNSVDKNGAGLVELLKKAMAEAGTTYNCYTPKVKAEMLCAGITSLLADAALGGGVLMAAKRISAVVKSKKALSNIRIAAGKGEKANLSDSAVLLKSDRLKAAEAVLARTLSEEEKRAVMSAHNIGKERGFGSYTGRDIADKGRALKKVKTIEIDERRSLMENGITGTETLNLKHGEKVRIAGQKKMGDAFEVGNKEKAAEGLADTKKYYEELAGLKDGDFKKVFTPDQSGLSTIATANEYGLSVSESAKLLEKMVRVNDLDAASSYRRAIGSLSGLIDEYGAMHAKKYSSHVQYKQYRAKELRAELLENYYTQKYPDKYKELDFDKMTPREQEMLSAIRGEIQESRKLAEKNKWPR